MPPTKQAATGSDRSNISWRIPGKARALSRIAGYPFQVLVTAEESGLDRDSKVQAGQIRSFPVERIRNALGSIPASLMLRVDEALRLHLSL